MPNHDLQEMKGETQSPSPSPSRVRDETKVSGQHYMRACVSKCFKTAKFSTLLPWMLQSLVNSLSMVISFHT